jgi:hypothetical protein
LNPFGKNDTPIAWAVTKRDIQERLEELLQRKPNKNELQMAIYMIGNLFSDWPDFLNENLNCITDPKRRGNLIKRWVA